MFSFDRMGPRTHAILDHAPRQRWRSYVKNGGSMFGSHKVELGIWFPALNSLPLMSAPMVRSLGKLSDPGCSLSIDSQVMNIARSTF